MKIKHRKYGELTLLSSIDSTFLGRITVFGKVDGDLIRHKQHVGYRHCDYAPEWYWKHGTIRWMLHEKTMAWSLT